MKKVYVTEHLTRYHEKDIARVIEKMSAAERQQLYMLLGIQRISEILPYAEAPEVLLQEMPLEIAAKVLSEVDSDDVVDILEKLGTGFRKQMVSLLDEESQKDVNMLLSYEEDEVGSLMTTNFIVIPQGLSVKEAMDEVIEQAGENDNIATIYIEDEKGYYYGAMDLKDLIIAREGTDLERIIATGYPYMEDHEKIADCLEWLKEYGEDSIPVLSKEGRILGVITAQDLVEVVDDEMGDDYAKLAGLSSEEDLHEGLLTSMKKRLPWLIILLFLGIVVSSVVGVFETVVAAIPIVMCFQSLILDMAGNVGTQSLAVTIRVLMDENISFKEKGKLILKEGRIGLFNGMCLGSMAFVVIGIYLTVCKHMGVAASFLISGCVGISLVLAMMISSFVGTLIPMMFKQLKIDPAVASGPLITTINDLVAVVAYYGLAWILLIGMFQIG